MATIALSLPEYNDLVVRAALLEYDRVISTAQNVAEPVPRVEIAGPVSTPLADPHKQRGFEVGLYDAGRPSGARRGGRPRVHRSQRQAQAAAARAYRERLRNGRALAPPPRPTRDPGEARYD